MASSPTIERVESRERYVLTIDDQPIGKSIYYDRGDTRVLTHTEIDEDHQGQGLGSRLVKFVLDDIRDAGLTVEPQCPMVAAYIEKHQEYADLVA